MWAAAGRILGAGALIAGKHVRVALLDGAVVALPADAAVAIIDYRAPGIFPPGGGLGGSAQAQDDERSRGRKCRGGDEAFHCGLPGAAGTR